MGGLSQLQRHRKHYRAAIHLELLEIHRLYCHSYTWNKLVRNVPRKAWFKFGPGCLPALYANSHCLIRIYYFPMSWWLALREHKPLNKINLVWVCKTFLLLRTLLSFMPRETAEKGGTKEKIKEDIVPSRFCPSVVYKNVFSERRESCRGSDQAKVSQAVAVAVSKELPVMPADLLNRWQVVKR